MERRVLSLKEQQDILYELLYTLDDFCKDNHIHYYLACGTLLGAVRHHGIIPWDDDVDVMMERDEYERFKKLITENPPVGYKSYHVDNTKGYYYPFMKFGKLGTVVKERDWNCIPKEGIGFNLDIFPIDGCPKDKVDAIKYVELEMDLIFRNIRYWRILGRKNFHGYKGKLYYIYYKIRRNPVFLKRYFSKHYKRIQKYSVKESDYCYVFWSFCGSKCMFSRVNIREFLLCPFGNRDLPIPIGYDEILKSYYGDYMTPPAERNSMHVREVYIEL